MPTDGSLMAGTIGAPTLAALCTQLKRDTPGHEPVRSRPLLAAIEREYARVRRAVREQIEATTPDGA